MFFYSWLRKKSLNGLSTNIKKDDVAVFQCGRNILRTKIIKKEEGNSICAQCLNKEKRFCGGFLQFNTYNLLDGRVGRRLF